MKQAYKCFLIINILILTILSINAQQKKVNQEKRKTTLDSLQGLWVLKIDTSQKIEFFKDTMKMYDHNKMWSKNIFYLSLKVVKEYEDLKKLNNKNNGCFLFSVDPEIPTMFKYAIEYLGLQKLILGFAHKDGGPYEYYRAKSISKH